MSPAAHATAIRYMPCWGGGCVKQNMAVRNLVLFFLLAGVPGLTAAMPPGREWAPIDTLTVHGHYLMVPGRFEPTIYSDTLRLVGIGRGGTIGKGLTGFVWADSSWRVAWDHRYDSGDVSTIPSSEHAPSLYLWKSQRDQPAGSTAFDYLLNSTASGDSLATPDTIAVVPQITSLYSGVATARTMWAAAWIDRDGSRLRVYERERPAGAWVEYDTVIVVYPGAFSTVYCASANDSTAIIVAGAQGVRWGHFSRGRWTPADLLHPWIHGAMPGPFRPAEFGYWVTWTTGDRDVILARYENGVITPERFTVTAHYPPSLYQTTDAVDVSQDTRPRPVIAWMAYGDDGVERLYVSWPNAAGWDTANAVPGATRGGHQRVARDENGDVWLAWFTFSGGIYWTHTYTTAICDTPRAGEASGRPAIHWTLDRPAPESWWTLWRSADGSQFEQLARLEAGPSQEMSYADSTAPSGKSLRYRVRRECKDVRYRWTSAEAEWLPRTARLRLALRSPNPVGGALAVEVLGAAAGALELQLFDLQGRLVARARATASGSGRDAVSLDPATGARPLRSGVYVLRAKGGDRRTSDGLKVVVLR